MFHKFMTVWFQLLSLNIGSLFSASKSFPLFLTQVDKVFLSTLYLAATFLLLSPFSRSLSGWHFSRSVLWVYFCFPATKIVRTNTTTTWRKNKQKNTHQYLASFKALKHSNILTFDSSIGKFEHFNIRTLSATHIMKALWIKNGSMSVHLRR